MFFFLCFRKSARPPFDKVTEGILFLVKHLLLTLSRNRPRCAACLCAAFDSEVVISGKPCCSVLQAKPCDTTPSSCDWNRRVYSGGDTLIYCRGKILMLSQRHTVHDSL